LNVREIALWTMLCAGIVLLTIGVASYYILFAYNENPAIPDDKASCSIYYGSINKTLASYEFGGKSISGDKVEEWYYIKGCEGEERYVRISRLSRVSDGYGVVLIHDYGSNYLMINGLAMDLVQKGYIVATVDLKLSTLNHDYLFNSDPRNTWIYRSVCSVTKTISLLEEKYRLRKIGLIGVGFGGVVALITITYDERVDTAISLNSFGNYEYGIERGSMLNYYVGDQSSLSKCLDPLPIIKSIDKPIMMIIGSDDELFPLSDSVINELRNNENIMVTIIPNNNHFLIPDQWKDTMFKYLDKVFKNESIREVSPKINVMVNEFEIVIESSDYENVTIISRPLIPGFGWSVENMVSDRARYSYVLFPAEYIVVDREYYRVYGVYKTREGFGLVIGLILILLWLIIKRDVVKHFRNMNIVEKIYLILMITLLIYPIYPTIWCPGRYHLSLIDIVETYRLFIPFITIPVSLSLVIQPILLVYSLSRKSRKAYLLYIAFPLYTIFATLTFLYFLNTKFYNSIILYPTTTLFITVALAIIEYVYGEKHS